jgi:hypothetical protein
MSLEASFNFMLNLHKRAVKLSRPAVMEVDIFVTPSNYTRFLAGPEEISMQGREYIISKTNLIASGFPALKKGDRITDSELGTYPIAEIKEMFDLGGNIIGYRVRTN